MVASSHVQNQDNPQSQLSTPSPVKQLESYQLGKEEAQAEIVQRRAQDEIREAEKLVEKEEKMVQAEK